MLTRNINKFLYKEVDTMRMYLQFNLKGGVVKDG